MVSPQKYRGRYAYEFPQPEYDTRRVLFGSPSAEDSHKKLRRELKALQHENREKWNFDFTTETPLPGRYKWVRGRSKTPPEGNTTPPTLKEATNVPRKVTKNDKTETSRCKPIIGGENGEQLDVQTNGKPKKESAQSKITGENLNDNLNL